MLIWRYVATFPLWKQEVSVTVNEIFRCDGEEETFVCTIFPQRAGNITGLYWEFTSLACLQNHKKTTFNELNNSFLSVNTSCSLKCFAILGLRVGLLHIFVQLNVSLLHCFCVLFNSFAKLYTHFWPFTSTSGGKIILQTLVVVITATSVCKMIFSILQPLVAVITATSVCNYSH